MKKRKASPSQQLATPPKQQTQIVDNSEYSCNTATTTTTTHTSTEVSDDEEEPEEVKEMAQPWEKNLLALAAAEDGETGTMVVRDEPEEQGTFVMRDDGDTNEPDIFGAKDRNVFAKDFWDESPETDLPTTLEAAHKMIRQLQQQLQEKDALIEKLSKK